MRPVYAVWILSAAIVLGGQARGMEFDRDYTNDHHVVLGATGEIKPGDDRKLHEFVGSIPPSDTVIGIVLKSPGGNLLEGVRLARTIRNSNITTAAISECASACFLMLAAGRSKLVQRGARIGVHSAGYLGGETEVSQAVTTQMARLANEFAVPPSIIGRMVSTPPTEMAWLSDEELLSVPHTEFMVVTNTPVANYEPGSALRTGNALTTTPSNTPSTPGPIASAGTVNPLLASPSPSFLAGREVRTDWEQWFAVTSGDVHDGADWWAGHRSTAGRDRVSCENQSGVSPAWTYGCQQARSKLTSADARRRLDPDFKAGWNSY